MKRTKDTRTEDTKPGYEKRYFVDPSQTETFAPLNSMNEHIARGAKEALISKFKKEKRDARVRLRRRENSIDLLVKLPKEVKVAGDQEATSTEAASVASVAN